MLVIKHISERSQLCEMHARSIASQLIPYGSSLDTFKSNFDAEFAKLKRVGTSYCNDFLKLEQSENKLVLWHFNANGDRDRKVFEVTMDARPVPNPFNF